jgi:hypothetical protein
LHIQAFSAFSPPVLVDGQQQRSVSAMSDNGKSFKAVGALSKAVSGRKVAVASLQPSLRNLHVSCRNHAALLTGPVPMFLSVCYFRHSGQNFGCVWNGHLSLLLHVSLLSSSLCLCLTAWPSVCTLMPSPA